MYIFSETRSVILHFKSYFILFCLGYLEIFRNKDVMHSELSLEARYAYVIKGSCRILICKLKESSRTKIIMFKEI